MSGSAIPASCYNLCNNAYIYAQQIGKQPQLCDINGPFVSEYIPCRDCVRTATGNATHIDPSFDLFYRYCLSLSNPATASGNSSISRPSTTTSWSSSGTAQQASVITIYTGSTSQSPSPQSGTYGSSSQNNSWIAGAVLGPLIFITVLALLALFLHRRRRRRRFLAEAGTDQKNDDPFGKAQLHSESLPPKKPVELLAEDPKAVLELPARELVGSEMYASIPAVGTTEGVAGAEEEGSGGGGRGDDGGVGNVSGNSNTAGTSGSIILPRRIKRKAIPFQAS